MLLLLFHLMLPVHFLMVSFSNSCFYRYVFCGLTFYMILSSWSTMICIFLSHSFYQFCLIIWWYSNSAVGFPFSILALSSFSFISKSCCVILYFFFYIWHLRLYVLLYWFWNFIFRNLLDSYAKYTYISKNFCHLSFS